MDESPGPPTILKIRGVRNGRQRLLVLSDGRELAFSDEACERAKLAEGQAATEEALSALEEAEGRVTAHAAALRLLAQRARSEREMRTRLGMRGVPAPIVEVEIERLREAGLLDDEKFARAWVEDRKRQAPRGRRLIRYELLGKGVARESIDTVTADIDDGETALQLARAKAAHRPNEEYDTFVARVGGFLRRRGFDYGVASTATRAAWQEMQAGLPGGTGE